MRNYGATGNWASPESVRASLREVGAFKREILEAVAKLRALPPTITKILVGAKAYEELARAIVPVIYVPELEPQAGYVEWSDGRIERVT